MSAGALRIAAIIPTHTGLLASNPSVPTLLTLTPSTVEQNVLQWSFATMTDTST
jgi:hypothetical protein